MTAKAMSALMVDGCADGDGLVLYTIAAAIGVQRRYDVADGNGNGFVGEVCQMIAAMMVTAMSTSMVMVMLMCCIDGDGNCVVSMVTTMWCVG